jgi:hypothetical protein
MVPVVWAEQSEESANLVVDPATQIIYPIRKSDLREPSDRARYLRFLDLCRWLTRTRCIVERSTDTAGSKRSQLNKLRKQVGGAPALS